MTIHKDLFPKFVRSVKYINGLKTNKYFYCKFNGFNFNEKISTAAVLVVVDLLICCLTSTVNIEGHVGTVS